MGNGIDILVNGECVAEIKWRWPDDEKDNRDLHEYIHGDKLLAVIYLTTLDGKEYVYRPVGVSEITGDYHGDPEKVMTFWETKEYLNNEILTLANKLGKVI